MIKLVDLYKEIIDKIGLEQTIKYMIIIMGIVLIYSRVIKNFIDNFDDIMVY